MDNDIRHHSGQNVVDSRGAANQIARLQAIVVKNGFRSFFLKEY